MDARALDAPQKDARRALRPACSSTPAARLFRCRAGAWRGWGHWKRHRERYRERRSRNLISTPARARTSASSQNAFEFPGTAVARTGVRGTTRDPAASPSCLKQCWTGRSQPPPSWWTRTRGPRSRAGRRASLRPRRREGIHPHSSRRTGRGGAFRRRGGRSANPNSTACCGGTEGSNGSAGGATRAQRRSSPGDRAARLRQEFVV